jgi:hypothetical protein
VVEGARLESEMGEPRQATLNHLIAQARNDLAIKEDHAVCVDKPPCWWKF